MIQAYRRLMGREIFNGVMYGVGQGLLSTIFRPIVLNLLIRYCTSHAHRSAIALTSRSAFCPMDTRHRKEEGRAGGIRLTASPMGCGQCVGKGNARRR